MKRFHYLSVALILIITAALIQNPYTTAYVSTMKFEDVSAVKQSDELYQTSLQR